MEHFTSDDSSIQFDYDYAERSDPPRLLFHISSTFPTVLGTSYELDLFSSEVVQQSVQLQRQPSHCVTSQGALSDVVLS